MVGAVNPQWLAGKESMQNIMLISDAHLGADSDVVDVERRERLLSFFRYVEQQAQQLIICGDLFDFWFEYKHAILRDHFEVLCGLSHLIRAGIRIDYLAGNHDFWLGSFLEQEIGVQVHVDDWELLANDRRIYLRHGDGLLKKDHLYRLLKRILRNRVNIQLYRLLHPDLGVPLALFFSRLSRQSARDQEDYTDIDYRRFAYAKIDAGCDYVVLGHTHWPACEMYGRGWYLNPGPWMSRFTFLQISAGGPALYQWDGAKAVEYHPQLPPGFTRNAERTEL
jgi:UDP-2,3-diacylglucosamine hydrolase